MQTPCSLERWNTFCNARSSSYFAFFTNVEIFRNFNYIPITLESFIIRPLKEMHFKWSLSFMTRYKKTLVQHCIRQWMYICHIAYINVFTNIYKRPNSWTAKYAYNQIMNHCTKIFINNAKKIPGIFLIPFLLSTKWSFNFAVYRTILSSWNFKQTQDIIEAQFLNYFFLSSADISESLRKKRIKI